MGLFQELRRRKVTRVAAVYVVTSWLLLQIVDVVADPLRLPEWFATVVVVLLAIGLPLALVLAWAFELTPEGVRRASSHGGAVAIPPGQSKMDFVLAGLLLIAIGWMVFISLQSGEPAQEQLDPVSANEAKPDVLHNSIAVLPFDNLSPNPEDAYFAAGIHEEILNQLAKIKDLAVIARTSVMGYSSTNQKIQDIARELNVGTVMEGSVRYAGDRVRITAQLIDATTGAHLWSETYDRELIDIFEVESDIAANITSAMQVEFSTAEQQAIGSVSTNDAQAYAHYVKALSHFVGFGSVKPMYAELDRAIGRDPNFATALATKAVVNGYQTYIQFIGDAPLTRESRMMAAANARRYAHRALAISPDEPAAYVALSLADQYYRAWGSAFANAERAYRLNPNQNFVLAQYADRLEAEGRFDEAVAKWRRVIEIDPLNPATIQSAALHGWNMAEWDFAIETADKMRSQFPDFLNTQTAYGLIAAYTGSNEQALAALQKAELMIDKSGGMAAVPDYNATHMILAYSRLGRPADALRMYSDFLAAYEQDEIGSNSMFVAAMGIQKYEMALSLLIEAASPSGDANLANVLRAYSAHPSFDPIRDDPRFEEAATKVGAHSR